MIWHPEMPEEYKNQIVTGDARELAKRIPDESIDLIFTDPPWDNESLPLYEWLAQTAMRILRIGGFLVAYTGNDWLPQIMRFCEDAGLTWFRMFAGVQLNSDDRYYAKRLFSKWRPIFVYLKGWEGQQQWMADAQYTNRDKRYHEWGQGEDPIRKWVNCFVLPRGIVFDPFTGGGTVPAVCKQLSRNYIAFEIDPETAEIARERVRNTQPPLFILEPEQKSMFDNSSENSTTSPGENK